MAPAWAILPVFVLNPKRMQKDFSYLLMLFLKFNFQVSANFCRGKKKKNPFRYLKAAATGKGEGAWNPWVSSGPGFERTLLLSIIS